MSARLPDHIPGLDDDDAPNFGDKTGYQYQAPDKKRNIDLIVEDGDESNMSERASVSKEDTSKSNRVQHSSDSRE